MLAGIIGSEAFALAVTMAGALALIKFFDWVLSCLPEALNEKPRAKTLEAAGGQGAGHGAVTNANQQLKTTSNNSLQTCDETLSLRGL